MTPSPGLDRANTLLMLIDLQNGPLNSVQSISSNDLTLNLESLLAASEILSIPLLITKAAIPSPGGELIRSLTLSAKRYGFYEHATNDSLGTAQIREALVNSGKTKIVIAGIAIDVGVLLTAISIKKLVYEVHVLTDVSGTLSNKIELAAWMRMAQEGIVLSSWTSFTGEITKDYTTTTGKIVRRIIGDRLDNETGAFSDSVHLKVKEASISVDPYNFSTAKSAGLKGKVARVTASSRGIGRSVAETLGPNGASVVVNFNESEQLACEVVKVIESYGSKAVAIKADIRKLKEVEHLISQTITSFGALDILVNNAGGGTICLLEDITEELFEQQFSFNAKGALFAMKEAVKHMRPGSRIINISATVSKYGVEGVYLYGGAKKALEYFTIAAAKELGPKLITVNTVCPGGISTDVFNSNAPDSQKKAALLSPLGSIGSTQDVADVVMFLASEDSRWINGQNIDVDGGALILGN